MTGALATVASGAHTVGTQIAGMDNAVATRPYSPEERAAIIEEVLPLLAQGTPTDEIAAPYGITGRALRYWLMNDERATKARKSFLDHKLLECTEAIETSDSALPLARAREAFRSWAWIAERRLPQEYGQRQQVEHHVLPVLNITVRTDSQPVTIEHEPIPEQSKG